ncbi:NAD(P)/FAD-dependent oxidoreductase [Taibaiella koreensis]|uniref:NAD(P)/FAD-dependent oxidoreductase n=1 Tax=Taibaiella koreensis TaxID=1268548 RepID=UPI000E59A587|nr:FAD-dependent oxidoreductase [Taibaiella koreensis]
MDLYAGFPFWLIKNPLYNYVNEVKDRMHTDVAIIGSGITGALVAHELCASGISCAIFDKRAVSTGSSAASTAQLQYEIDVPLFKLLEKIPEKPAVIAYRASLQSISDIEQVFRKAKIDAEFQRRSSLFLASDKKGCKEIKKEFLTRKKYGLPVNLLEHEELQQTYGINRLGALWNEEAAQMDAYRSAILLLQYNQRRHDLRLYPYTRIAKHEAVRNGYVLHTDDGKQISCHYLIVAAGYEAGQFLPRKVMDLSSTYALVTEPLRPDQLWHDESLIWETALPYFYLRVTADHRIMMGGEDVPFRNERLRDALLSRKTKRLLEKFAGLFPHIPVHCDMTWCGTFSSTKDGLPYIGAYPGSPNLFFALGYGGNGITFSMIAAQMIRNKLKGVKDERESVFGFDRK